MLVQWKRKWRRIRFPRCNFINTFLLGAIVGYHVAVWSPLLGSARTDSNRVAQAIDISEGSSRISVGWPARAPAARARAERTVAAPGGASIESRHVGRLRDLVRVQPGLLFVGVMTAQQFLDSRVKAVHDTWGQHLPGRMAFFTAERSSPNEGLPVVRLKAVTDQYPPQKKSFMMLKYMHDHYIDKFEWFMRADDDVYVHVDRLEKLLRSINSSQAMFIGRAGFGKTDEKGQLGINQLDNYCMGGPGIVMSRATLKLIYPHIRTCLRSLVSNHEDVELGRCVRQYAGVNCLWNLQMADIFQHDFRGSSAYEGALQFHQTHQAMTLHPIKVPRIHYKLHDTFLQAQLRTHMHERRQRECDIVRTVPEDQRHILTARQRQLGDSAVLDRTPVNFPEENICWAHLDSLQRIHSAHSTDPRAHVRAGIQDALVAFTDYASSLSQGLSMSRTLPDINYAYYRVSPLDGAQSVLDVTAIWGPAQYRRRRHVYLQQSFGPAEVRVTARESPTTEVHVVVALEGAVADRFARFCDNLWTIGLRNIRLYLIVYRNAVRRKDLAHIQGCISKLRSRFAPEKVVVRKVVGKVAWRCRTLSVARSLLADDALMLLLDVDVLPNRQAIDNIRQFTQRGKQMYFPVVFGEYEPALAGGRSAQHATGAAAVDARRGTFRHQDFHVASIYASDVDALAEVERSGGGSSVECELLIDRVLQHPLNYTVFRAPDPDMVRRFQPTQCADSGLQVQTCGRVENESPRIKKQLADEYLRTLDRMRRSGRS